MHFVLQVSGSDIARNYSYFRVWTGSSRAARFAGSVPKSTPTSTEVASEITADQGLMGILKGVSRPSVKRNGEAEQRADDPATERKEDGFGEKLQSNLAAGCAQGLANADLFDARLHIGQHAVHDADAADDQRDSRRERKHDGQHVGDFRHATAADRSVSGQCRRELA